MDTIKNTKTYLSKICFMNYVLCFLMLALYKITDINLYFYLCIITYVMIVFFYIAISKNQSKMMKLLIQHADAIIDQKPFCTIDGEGDIALLSHKLFLLSKRYHTLIWTVEQEKVKLKDYIEDISHQLKTPITSMRLNEELLLETPLQPTQYQKIENIYQQTLKMNHLVDDLLTLTKLDANSISFQFHDYDVEDIFEIVEENLDYLIKENKVAIEYHYHHEMILCDQLWLSEAIENIMKNFIEKNKNQKIFVDVDQYDSLTLMKIYDHGNGFLEKDIPHLFERFYRGQNNDNHGVGIGLSLAKEIIDKHHGIVRAYNQKGAVIEISIPQILAKKKL